MRAHIQLKTFDFLHQLAANNNREWFLAHKDAYQLAYANLVELADELLDRMQQHDKIETASGKKSLMRIYRDTRFSLDKTPYRTYFGGSFRRATARLRGGYYYQLGPGNGLVAGGFFSPNPDDLYRIRKDIELNYEDWFKLLDNPKLKETFGELRGEKLKTAPKGFDKDHPAVELLKHKQFYFERELTDEECLRPDIASYLNKCFKNLRPYFDYMSEVLTTDDNGESIL